MPFVLLLVLMLCGSASAQDQPSNDPRERLIEEGVELRGTAQDEQALDRFTKAAALHRDGRVVAQIGFAEQAMGRWGDAFGHLTEALHDAGNPWVREHETLIREELEKISANVGRLDIRTNIQVAKLTIDGKEVGITPLSEPIVLTSGSVVVSASAEGYMPTTKQVPVYPRSLARVELVLVPVPVVAVASSHREVDVVRRNPLWLYLAGGGTAIALASLGPWLRGEKMTTHLKNDCSAMGSCPNYDDDDHKVRRLDRATNALLFSGIGVGVASLATYFLWPQHERRTVTPTAMVSREGFALAARVAY